MARSAKPGVVNIMQHLRNGNGDGEGLVDLNGDTRRVDEPRRFPLVSTLPRLPVMIPDEILDYYGWVFCQGGFLNLQMTFEQFLAVVAALSPTGLCPEYDDVIAAQDF